MPELPEVETVARGLAPVLSSRRVTAVEVREPRLRRRIARDFPAALVGRQIATVGRHGKYLLLGLDDGRVWLVHLGMTGRLTVAPTDAPVTRHDHVWITLDDGTRVIYHDPRRFGLMMIVAAAEVGTVTGCGVDALAAEFTPAALFRLARGRRTSIKALLMDQHGVAGLGNIYASELLFRAGVRPGRASTRLSRAECARIVVAARAVLEEAVASGGSSISDYRDGFGREGSFQVAHQVYERAGQPCRQCAGPIRRRLIAGRSTFYCSVCQR